MVVFPVNFRALDGDVVFRSGHDGSVGQLAPDEPVSFEVDHIDDAMSEGWSVLATGTVHVVRNQTSLVRSTLSVSNRGPAVTGTPTFASASPPSPGE
jgi:pyridoxamine 5'-phosphate oxidase-like protein